MANDLKIKKCFTDKDQIQDQFRKTWHKDKADYVVVKKQKQYLLKR